MPEVQINMAVPSDSPAIAAILADPLVQRRAHLMVVPDPTAVAMLMQSTHLLTIRCDKQIVGIMTLEQVTATCWELGYLLRRTDWGKGIMTAAVGLLCDRLLPGNCLRATVDDDNIGSQRILIKNGFAKETDDGEQGKWFFQKGLALIKY